MSDWGEEADGDGVDRDRHVDEGTGSPRPVSRRELEQCQLERLNAMLHTIHEKGNRFQRGRVPAKVASLGAFRREVGFTEKADLAADRQRHPPFGSNLTFPLEEYTRYCQTSGTSGEPLAWLDTKESWQAMLDCWKVVYRAADLVSREERVFFAFSYGPFLGFWTAFEAATQLGFLSIPCGGMRSEGRLQMMRRFSVTALCCTPTYALRLGAIAASEAWEFPTLKAILVAGEPGGSLPEVRARLRDLWGEAVAIHDHHGLTETGPVSYQDPERAGWLRVMEEAFLAEVVDPESGEEVAEGETGELVLTTLHRIACPLFRYRTGDLVRKRLTPDGLALEGGILGRIDDMVLIRGVNVYPGAIEGVVRRFREIGEYRVVQSVREDMGELAIEFEAADGDERLASALQDALWDQFQLRIPVRRVPEGTLPEQEFKARRWHLVEADSERP